MASEDRPRGFLTPDDRDYIRNDREYGSRQQHSNKRRTIRDRIENGIQDFLVVRRFDRTQRQRIYDEIEYGSDLYRGLVAAIAFAYQAAETGTGEFDFEELVEDGVELGIRTPAPPDASEDEENDSGKRREDVRSGTEDVDVEVDPEEISDEALQAARELPPMVRGTEEKVAIKVVEDIDVSIDIEYRDVPNPMQLRRRFLEGEELSDEELGWLLKGGLLSDEEAWGHLEERFKGRDG